MSFLYVGYLVIKIISVLLIASVFLAGCNSTKVKKGKISANSDYANVCIIHRQNPSKRPSNSIFEQLVQNSFESFGIPSTLINSNNDVQNNNCSHVLSYKIGQKRNITLKYIKLKLYRVSASDRRFVGAVTYKETVDLNNTQMSQQTVTDLLSRII